MPVVVASVRRSWALLTASSRRRYVLIVLAQMATGLLDLLGVALIGLMGLAAAAAVSGSTTTLAALPGFDRWEGEDPAALAVALAAAAAVALLARSLAYGLLLRVNYRLLAHCQTEATGDLLARYLRRPIVDIQATASQSTAYALSTGAGAAITGLLGALAVILTDSALLVLLGLGLLALSPAITIAAVAYLGALLLLVHFSLSRWSARNGGDLGRTGVSTIVSVQEGIGLYRELWALGRLGEQYEQTRANLASAAIARGTLTLIGQIPKVVYDAALVLGALLLVAWQLPGLLADRRHGHAAGLPGRRLAGHPLPPARQRPAHLDAVVLRAGPADLRARRSARRPAARRLAGALAGPGPGGAPARWPRGRPRRDQPRRLCLPGRT